MQDETDVLWSLYQDHTNQGQHHEEQRTSATGLVAVLCAGILGLIALDNQLNTADMPLVLFLVFIGVFGALLNSKHHERFWFHTERAREYRDALQKLVPTLNLRALREAADARGRKRHPILSKISVFYLWVAFDLLVALIGVILLISVLRN